MTYDPLELAWVAGFIDGEGCFRCKKNKMRTRDKHPIYGIRLSIAQVDPYVLYRVQRALDMGKVLGPYGPYSNKSQSPHYQYVLCTFEGVQAAIALLWKFLSPIKQRQALDTLKNFHVGCKCYAK